MSRSEALDATTDADAVSRDRVVALLPMRHDSERVPGKNYRPLDGRPLFHHVVDALRASERVDGIVIDTDSPLIAADVAGTYPGVTVLERPEELRGGDVPMNDVLVHDVTQVEAEWLLADAQHQPAADAPTTIRRAVDEFFLRRADHDSLFSVTPLQTRLWTPDGRPLNHDPDVLLRTQDLPPVLEENSCLYLFDKTDLLQRRNRIGRAPAALRRSRRARPGTSTTSSIGGSPRCSTPNGSERHPAPGHEPARAHHLPADAELPGGVPRAPRAHDLALDVPQVLQAPTEDELIEIIGEADGIIAGDDPLTARVLEQAKRLRVISKWGVGTDGIDKAAAARLGIEVTEHAGGVRRRGRRRGRRVHRAAGSAAAPHGRVGPAGRLAQGRRPVDRAARRWASSASATSARPSHDAGSASG